MEEALGPYLVMATIVFLFILFLAYLLCWELQKCSGWVPEMPFYIIIFATRALQLFSGPVELVLLSVSLDIHI